MKRSTIAYCALGITVLAAGGVWWWEDTHQPVKIVKEAPLLPNFHSEKVAKIAIVQLLDGITLERLGDHWEARQTSTPMRDAILAEGNDPAQEQLPELDPTSYPADTAQVQNALNALRSGISAGLVARSGAQQDSLQVGKLALHVRAFDAIGTELANLHIGKQGADFLSSYVRVGDGGNVYLVRDQLRSRFSTQLANWRDKMIWQLDADQIAAVAVTRRTGNFTIEKGKDHLFRRSDLATGGALDQLHVRDWFARWKILSAADVPMHLTEETSGVAKSKESLRVTMQDGKKYTLVLGNATKDGGVYATLDGRNTIYVLPTTFKPVLGVDIDAWAVAADDAAATPTPDTAAHDAAPASPAPDASPDTAHHETHDAHEAHH